MALKKQIKETKAAEVKAAAETKEEVKTAVKAAEDKVSEKVEEVKTNQTPIRKQEWSSKRSRKLKNMFNSNLFYL